MKKILFSAVALTAFSFSTMANNEVKEVEQVKEDQVLKTKVDCMQIAYDALELIDPSHTMDAITYDSYFTPIHTACEANNP